MNRLYARTCSAPQEGDNGSSVASTPVSTKVMITDLTREAEPCYPG